MTCVSFSPGLFTCVCVCGRARVWRMGSCRWWARSTQQQQQQQQQQQLQLEGADVLRPGRRDLRAPPRTSPRVLRLTRVASAGATAAAAAAATAAAEAAVGNGSSSGSSSSGSSSSSSLKVLTSSGPTDETEKLGPEYGSRSAVFYPPWAVVVTFGSVTFGSGTTHTSIHTRARGKPVVSARRGHDGFTRAAGGSVWP